MQLHWSSQILTPEEVYEAYVRMGLFSIPLPPHEEYFLFTTLGKHYNHCLIGRPINCANIIHDLCEGPRPQSIAKSVLAKYLIDQHQKVSQAYFSADGRKYWPDPTSPRTENKNSRYSFQITIKPNNRVASYCLESSILTMGSCFVNELNKLLLKDRLLNTQNQWPGVSTQHSFPESWGTIFNPFSALHNIRYFTGKEERPELYWTSNHSGEQKLYDPFREDVIFDNLDSYKQNVAPHRAQSLHLLRNAKVLLLAFSMAETWFTTSPPFAPLARSPWKLNPLAAEPKLCRYPDLIECLISLSSELSEVNPDLTIIYAVDPVPLHATFGFDTAIEADAYGKASLVSAMRDHVAAASKTNIHYFPCYEKVHYCIENPWSADERHLAKSAIDSVYKELLILVGQS